MDKDKIEMKALMESAAVADYLTELAKGFKSGVITVEKDGECLTLTPAETAEVEVEARVKKDKARFSLEVSWRLAEALDEPASLKISAEAPAAQPAPETQPEATPVVKVISKPEAKAEAKAEAKPEAKTEAKPAPATAPAKPEAKPEAKVDTKAPAK